MEILEIIGAATALLGSALLASARRNCGYGFALYLLSNLAWIGYAIDHGILGLLVMQCGFLATSILGIRRWLLPRGRMKISPIPKFWID